MTGSHDHTHSHDHSHDHHHHDDERWKHDGVRVIPGNQLDPNVPSTAGMDRKAAINFARVGAQKLWAGTVSIKPDAKTGAHHHGHLESIIYVVKGKARMRWGEKLQFTAEAGPGDFIFVPPYVPHQEINASPDEVLECVLVRSDGEAVAINLDIEPVEKPENVLWVDPVHRHPDEKNNVAARPEANDNNSKIREASMTLVHYESADYVATITMARSEKHNALNNALCSELRDAWLRFRDSDDRVAVLASAEETYFSVGADVADLPANMWHAVPGLGIELDKPVIAATSGWVVGGAFVLVQMADLCVASETTRFIYPEGKIGTTAGGVSSVMARMPHKIAMEFLLVGEEMSAERAFQIGFVNKVAPKGQHVAMARQMAAKIAGNAPLVVRALKKLAREAMPKGPLETVADVRRLLDEVRDSDDLKEGVKAFSEKRKPRFTGK